MPRGALDNLRILDLTDERAIYGAKMLADLGAEVVRPEPPDGDPLRRRGPRLEGTTPGVSLWHAFFASSRRFVTLEPDTEAGRALLEKLVDRADVVLVATGAFGVAEASLDEARRLRPELVVVETSSFGPDGPWRDYLAPDLVAGALGGAVATTGDADTPPLKTFGDLNFILSGAYTAIAALAALYRVRETGTGQRVHVSVHECIASCLEHVLLWYWYHDRMPNAASPALERRGSLHWSNAYVVMPARDGAIMVTPTPSFDNQLVWLIEKDAQEDLLDPKYQEPEHRRDYIRRFMEVLRNWVATRDVEELFFEAQDHHAPYGWVLAIDKVAENPQLEARDWWVDYPIARDPVRGPGAPYRFEDTPWRLGPYGRVGADTEAVKKLARLTRPLRDGTCPSPTASSQTQPDLRPLTGVRVLDFTHVLAGPFATRVLADLGADVVKVVSATRMGANAPDGVYYVTWNRNKRAVALDMSHAESRATCQRLAEAADVVIDNFSVGVLDRWGVGYDMVSPSNPGAIYVQMSGMGAGGPWSGFVTYAPTIHALAGLTYLTGVPGRKDIGIGFSYNDHCAGLHGAFAILAALEARRHTGRGQRVDLSQFEVGVGLAGPSLLDYFANGRAAEPTGNKLPYDCVAPHGCYPCAGAKSDALVDERWVAIACMTDDQWRALARSMGDPAWTRDPILATAQGRADFADLDVHVGAWTRTLTATEAMERCQAAGVPAGVVQTGADLGDADPQLKRSRFLFPVEDQHPVLGQTYADRLPLHFAGTPCDVYRRTRRLGEDNVAVLADWLGMTEAEVKRGEERGHFV
ncbi:MAG: CoA transferase [Gammaproteobacteria bacterium]|nr:CoA transferase [Gammaproteobacteria bacterium]